jgi:hypothetical protein
MVAASASEWIGALSNVIHSLTLVATVLVLDGARRDHFHFVTVSTSASMHSIFACGMIP